MAGFDDLGNAEPRPVRLVIAAEFVSGRRRHLHLALDERADRGFLFGLAPVPVVALRGCDDLLPRGLLKQKLADRQRFRRLPP